MKEEPNEDQTIVCPIGQALKKIRESKGLSLRDLGRLTRRSWKYIKQIEKGEREPKATNILRLERAMGLAPGELIKETDALMPDGWARPSEEDKTPKKPGRPKKSQE